jgi:hypothetical protein
MVVVRGMQMSDRRDRRRRMEEEHNAWQSVVLVVEDIVHLVFCIFVSLPDHPYVASLSLSPFVLQGCHFSPTTRWVVIVR